MGGRFPIGLWAAGLIFLAGCGGKTEKPPLWIGHIAPLSGPDKAAGESARRGIRLAVEEANKHPDEQGAGQPVRVLHANSRGDPEAFGAEATRLVRVNRVVGLLGGSSAEDIKAFRRLEGTGVCLVSPAGSVGESARGGNVFFTGLTPAQQGKGLARFAAQKGFTNVLVLVDTEESSGRGRALADAFKDKFPQIVNKKRPRRKGVVTGPWRYGADVPLKKRLRQVVRAVKMADSGKTPRVDAILVAGKPEAVVKIREETALSRLPVFFGGEEGNIRTLAEEPETNHNLYLATAFVADAGTDQAAAFVKKFKERFSEEPDVCAALAYDDARLLFTALRQAKNLDADSVRTALGNLKEFASLTGPLSFSDGQARRTAFIVRIDQGAPVKVKRHP
jgi:branched-chain amino acid transport system substrate-binding protein